jgi:D-3-phosphoglycerate dehydrogenase / 2-oxoglutarate reductase
MLVFSPVAVASRSTHGGDAVSRIVFLTHPVKARELWYGAQAVKALERLATVRLNEGTDTLRGEDLVETAQGCDVIVSDRGTPGAAALFAGVDSLVAFVRCAMDIRNIDVKAASANGVLITRASPGWIDAVAELVLGQMINLARHLPEATMTYRIGHIPAPSMGAQLAGKTLGIIGYGNLGRRLAELGHALRMRVLVSDPYAMVTNSIATQVDLPSLLSSSDVVVCLAAETDETENLIDAAAFRQMNPGSVFINASRGSLVDETALEEALGSGRLAGAAFDVGRAEDNLPTPRLARLPNVLATPHVGGLVPEAIAHQALETVDQVAAIFEGRIPNGAVNGADAARLRRRLPPDR